MESTNKPSIRENGFKRYTVTTALPYANGPVHIGHLAGVYIPADTFITYFILFLFILIIIFDYSILFLFFFFLK